MWRSEKVSRAANNEVGSFAVASSLRGAVKTQRSTCLEVDREPMRNAAIYASAGGVQKGGKRQRGHHVVGIHRAIHRVDQSVIVHLFTILPNNRPLSRPFSRATLAAKKLFSHSSPGNRCWLGACSSRWTRLNTNFELKRLNSRSLTQTSGGQMQRKRAQLSVETTAISGSPSGAI